VSTIPKRGPDVLMHIGRRNIASRKRKFAGLFAFVLAGVIGVGVYAFTASNEVPEKRAGAGSGEVSGYKVTSQVSYTFSEDGTKMTKVNFTLDNEASDVQVALSEGLPEKADWTDCGASTGLEVECTFPGEGVEDAKGDKLSVAAVSEGNVVIG
jgi:hypothetical protein